MIFSRSSVLSSARVPCAALRVVAMAAHYPSGRGDTRAAPVWDGPTSGSPIGDTKRSKEDRYGHARWQADRLPGHRWRGAGGADRAAGGREPHRGAAGAVLTL